MEGEEVEVVRSDETLQAGTLASAQTWSTPFYER